MRITAVGLLKDIMHTYIRQQWLCNDAHFQQLFRGCHPTKVVFELVAAYFVRWIYVCPSGCTMYIRTYCHVILMQNKYHPPRNLHLTNRDTHHTLTAHTHTHTVMWQSNGLEERERTSYSIHGYARFSLFVFPTSFCVFFEYVVVAVAAVCSMKRCIRCRK